MSAADGRYGEGTGTPLVDVACLVCGAIAVLVAWGLSGLRLTIPLAGLWLLVEAALPGDSRPPPSGTAHAGRVARRAVDLAGYGGAFAVSVLLVSGGIGTVSRRPLAGVALAVTGVTIAVVAVALVAAMVRSERHTSSP